MTTQPRSADTGRMRLAPEVTLTHLPFGGAIMVNGTTLALAEFDESDAVLVDRLLRHGVAGAERDPSAVVRALGAGDWLMRGAPEARESAAGDRAADDTPTQDSGRK